MINDLRRAGKKVKVCHYRTVINPKLSARDYHYGTNPFVKMSRGEFEANYPELKWGDYVLPYGGATYVSVDGEESYAVCSTNENYRKKRGVEIALGRLMCK